MNTGSGLPDAFLGLDLGTTECKALALDSRGHVLAEYRQACVLEQPSPGYAEQDACQWWSQAAAAIRHLSGQLSRSHVIRALGLSTQGISFVPVDRQGQPLGRAISWLDSRAGEQVHELEHKLPRAAFYQRTGKRLNAAYTLPKLMWLEQNKPELAGRTWKYLLPLDYLTLQLTGRAVTDYAMASGTLAFNIHTGQWDSEILALSGIAGDKLPSVGLAGSPVGPVLPGVCAGLGLPEGTMVHLGTQDQKCAALAAGLGPGTATVSLGTASAISTLSTRPVLDEAMRIPLFALGSGRWVLESVIGTACASLNWLSRTAFQGLSPEGMTRMAGDAPPGSNGLVFLPHLAGAGSPFWTDEPAGAILGLSLATGSSDLARSVLEGIACQIRTNLGLHEQLTGQQLETVRLFGGGSNSTLWCRIIADLTGCTVWQMQPEMAALGAALLALGRQEHEPGPHSAGAAPEPDAVRSSLVRQVYEPDPAGQAVYDRVYRRYRILEDKYLA